MLQIGNPKAKILVERINGLDYEGVHFEVVGAPMGLTFKVSHNAESDAAAKSLMKKFIAEQPECKNSFTNIQYIDENGKIL